MYVCMYVCVCVCVCMYVCMNVCMYVCMYVNNNSITEVQLLPPIFKRSSTQGWSKPRTPYCKPCTYTLDPKLPAPLPRATRN